MITLKEIDPSSPFLEQLGEEEGPIVLINTFVFPDGTRDAALDAWTKDATFMLAQPGCVSTQLHEGIGSSHTMVNVAVWESTAALRTAFSQPRFQAGLAEYPDGSVSLPHILRKLAVEDICGD